MKKVLFLQNKGKSYAGVWNVNKLVGEELIKKGYCVSIISIRENKNNIKLEYDNRLIVDTINKKDLWETYHMIDIIKELKKLHFLKIIKIIISRINYNIGIKKDIKKLHKYIYNYKPNYIITSHYQLIDMIPKEYLKITIHEQHSSFEDAINNHANKKTLDKYKDKIKFLWLSKSSMEKAVNMGYKNSTYIYNAVRIHSDKKADVNSNKKLITISRLSKEKRIDLMIEIVEDIFKEEKYNDWIIEIYGDGNEKEYLNSKINNNRQIKLKGVTNNPKVELLSSSIHLNTSKYEGFSLSILEANECGVPTISFEFGESAQEEIINNETGIIVRNIAEYKSQLKKLMDNPKTLEKMSTNAKNFSKKFQISNIINDWITLFNEINN